jgi:pimeloyl-ACP methyl ester carboxylesterase
MRRWVLLVCSILVLMVTGRCYADVQEEYEQASEIYIAAGACMAVYGDRYGSLAIRYMEQDGWRIDRYVQTNGSVNARFLLAKKQFSGGRQMYVLAIVGTENARDMQIDLKMDKIYFGGSTLEEFVADAAKKGVPPTEPKVHRGFHEFVQAGLTAKTLEANGETKLLTEILLTNKDRKIYLVGHSLGGAAATLAGARLISMGVRPEQIEIITFGAPAVGNAAFAAQFESVLNLTRVVLPGDPVTNILQKVVSEYKQFGRKIQWDVPATAGQHDVTEYVDVAIKNYYDKRQLALQAGVVQPSPSPAAGVGGVRIYVAPLKNSLPRTLAGEFWYMQQALRDEYHQTLPGYVIADEIADDDLRKKAVDAGCKWLVIPEVSGFRLRQEKNVYHITLHQTIYETATGAVVKAASFSTGTYNLTPLEAFIHNYKGMSSSLGDWLVKAH